MAVTIAETIKRYLGWCPNAHAPVRGVSVLPDSETVVRSRGGSFKIRRGEFPLRRVHDCSTRQPGRPLDLRAGPLLPAGRMIAGSGQKIRPAACDHHIFCIHPFSDGIFGAGSSGEPDEDRIALDPDLVALQWPGWAGFFGICEDRAFQVGPAHHLPIPQVEL